MSTLVTDVDYDIIMYHVCSIESITHYYYAVRVGRGGALNRVRRRCSEVCNGKPLNDALQRNTFRQDCFDQLQNDL